MGTRLVVFEVADTQSEDMLLQAISHWNETNRSGVVETFIHHRFLYSCPVGDQRTLAETLDDYQAGRDPDKDVLE